MSPIIVWSAASTTVNALSILARSALSVGVVDSFLRSARPDLNAQTSLSWSAHDEPLFSTNRVWDSWMYDESPATVNAARSLASATRVIWWFESAIRAVDQ